MLTVLIVDDSAANRFRLRNQLEELGHEVIGEAANGFAGVEQYIKYRPQLVTLDIVMPEMDGFAALAKIMEFDPTAKVVMASSSSTRSNRDRATEMGAMGFMGKPIERQELALALLEIERVLKERAA